MHIGYDKETGHVYEGGGQPVFACSPAPMLLQAKLVEAPDDLDTMPQGLTASPFSWVFREESFDPVTRVRRGRLYESFPGAQPSYVMTRGHPSNVFSSFRDGDQLQKRLFRYWPCLTLLGKARGGHGLTLALGQARGWSTWRITQVEHALSDEVLVTLKSLCAFGLLPELRVDLVPKDHLQPVLRAIERVLDSAHRESPISVIDHCRNAAVVILGRWVFSKGEAEQVLSMDLGAIAKKLRDDPYRMVASAGMAEMLARLHARGKANEQESKGLRLAQEEDGQAAVHGIGFLLREVGWA